MKLPIPGLSKKTQAEYYLALVLRNERATSVLFSKTGNTIKYLGHGEEDFENTIEDATTEQFLEVLDKSITQAETVLPDNIETRKTIFGLKDAWIENNKIKKEYLEKLKKASDELGLQPIGFLVSAESIVNLLQKDEGAPVTAVLVEMGQKFVTVSLIKSGKIVESKSSEIHQSAPFTVDTLLKHFQSSDGIPARVVIYGDDEEEVTQEFIGHPWSKTLPFLHLPQITSLPKDASIKAMLLGAATQMGAELLYDAQSVDFDQEPTKISPDEVSNFAPVEMPEVEKPKEETKEETIEGEQAGEAKTAEPKLDYVDKDNSLEFFGFTQGDVAKTPKPEPAGIAEEKVPDTVIKEEIAAIPEEQRQEEEKKIGPVENALIMASKFKQFVFGLGGLFGAGNQKRKMVLSLAAIVIILIVGGLFFLMLNTTATVAILVNPKTDQKTTSVTFSSKQATDIGNKILASQPLTVSEDGTMSTNASGSKDVGTAAKGSVTIFNIGTGELTLPSGTTLTAPNGLVFTLDSAVTVASGDAILGASTGTANVTAGDIGQEYNLPSGTKFTVSGQDASVAAKNDNAFSGGSKKTVTVVSKDDIQKLLSGLPKQLEAKARTDIAPKVTGDNVLLSSFVSETVNNDSQSLSQKAGDQAASVTLKGTVDFAALTYNSGDMLKLTQALFGTGSTQISQSNLAVTAKNIVDNGDGSVTADLQINAGLLPNLDSATVIKQITGLPVSKARNLLLNMPQVENVGIDLKPSLPFLSQNLPASPKNITIQITAK
ncbi:MAG: baseplate J/gp47 family protein [Candidatus Levyibacteriota bacterium]